MRTALVRVGQLRKWEVTMKEKFNLKTHPILS